MDFLEPLRIVSNYVMIAKLWQCFCKYGVDPLKCEELSRPEALTFKRINQRVAT